MGGGEIEHYLRSLLQKKIEEKKKLIKMLEDLIGAYHLSLFNRKYGEDIDVIDEVIDKAEEMMKELKEEDS